VVDDKNIAVSRKVTLGDLQGDSWLMRDGLKPGERVIVEGLQKVQPGTPVRIAQTSTPQPQPASERSGKPEA